MPAIENPAYDEKMSNLVLNDLSPSKSYSSINNGNEPVLPQTSSLDPANRVTLSWYNINVFVRESKNKFPYIFRNQYDLKAPKQLLHNVNGQVTPGQLLAIMGASGSGKPTLLNVLTNRNLGQLVVDGEVLVNGEYVGAYMTRISAYVQQDDLFIGTLTVREHLVFQALLRMDKHRTYNERMARVEEVMLELGLTKCVNTMIGSPGRFQGISGGEKKRLAFAAEVLTNPCLMFCDEPTSGLDSFMSQNVVSVLKDLAIGGRTIVCTIHQPSSEVYEMFDNLLLMAEGRVAYMGATDKALEFFQKAGLRCPVNYNPADFFIHNLAILPGNEENCREKVKSIYTKFANEYRQLEKTSFSRHSLKKKDLNANSRYKASWWVQFMAVLWRSWLSSIRESLFTKFRIIQNMIVAIFLGLIYLRQNIDEKGVMNINGAMFLLIIHISFQCVYSVVNTFCSELPLFLREHWNGMYRSDVYFLSKTLAETPVLLLGSGLFTIIVYWMVGLNSDYKAFLICLGVCCLVALASASFGYMTSCISGSINIALTISNPLMIPLFIFGGFYLNNASVPIYFEWIKYISWYYYGNEALIINQWSSINHINCTTRLCPYNGTSVIENSNFSENNFLRDIVLIFAVVVFYRFLAFVALLIKSRRRT